MSKNSFCYEQIENIDSLFNYLNTLNKGLKDRHISFGSDKDLLKFFLPEEASFKIEAKAKKKSAWLSIQLKWDLSIDINKKDNNSKILKKSEKKKLGKEIKQKNKSETEVQITQSINKNLMDKKARSAEKTAEEKKPTAKISTKNELLVHKKQIEVLSKKSTKNKPDL